MVAGPLVRLGLDRTQRGPPMNQSTIDTAPLWKILDDLPWSAIPDDLSEIDESWCFYRLEDQVDHLDDDELANILDRITWQILHNFAYDLRDIWHTARVENAEFLRGWW